MLLIQSCCNMISIGVTRCLRLSNFTGSPNRRHGPPVIFSYSLMCIWDAKLPLGGCQSASSKVTRWTRHGEKGWEMRERERERCFVITSPDKWTRDSLIPPPSPPITHNWGSLESTYFSNFSIQNVSDPDCKRIEMQGEFEEVSRALGAFANGYIAPHHFSNQFLLSYLLVVNSNFWRYLS